MVPPLPTHMAAVLLTGHGGLDKLDYREDVPVPDVGPGDVLIRVAAAGMNNTDINTRIGWYSKSVTGSTDAGAAEGFESISGADSSWAGAAIDFPRIQGADCCGHIVAVGNRVDPGRIGERVIVQSIRRAPSAAGPYDCWTFGSECDGGFAQFAKTAAEYAHRVQCDWSDVDLASIPCAWSTAENMLHRASVGAGLGAERTLITGASGGVGSSTVQLAKRRGAEVVAVAGASKADHVRRLGADRVLDRGSDLVHALGRESIDVIIDLVGGPGWPALLDVLRRGGRYATAGAIAGPIVDLDLRTLYLKDLTLLGCTAQDDAVFRNLIGYIERGEIRPVVDKTYPLRDIRTAQQDFIAKTFTGKLVLIPPD